MRTLHVSGSAALALALLLNGCREGVPPFTPPEPAPPTDAVRQITFGTGHDRDPRWAPDGATLFYHTSSFGTLPQSRGVLLRLDPVAGRATPLFEDVQRQGSVLLATPTPSNAGDRVAYMHLHVLDDIAQCNVPVSAPPVANYICATQPLLGAAFLRVRRLDAAGSFLDDPSILLTFPGTDPSYRFGGDGPYTQRIYAFQALHRDEQALLFRPSWSPDGQRVVVSNGVRLLIWRPGSAAFDTVPGTADGVSPAWSPDGQWLAFTQFVYGDSVSYACGCVAPGNTVGATHNRILHTHTDSRLVLIRPDGSERIDLGVGEEPAWSPDGQHIYALRDDIVVRIPRSGGAAVAIPDTQRGRSPAVSPDGRWLAFSRAKLTDTRDHDIWLVSLEQ
jgi:dipeptidyl aminopeptidase/acylaminoacyl peptidase